MRNGTPWVIVFLLLWTAGCAPALGRYVAKTTNHGHDADRLDDAHNAPPVMPGAVIDYRIRVAVSDPTNTLSVWVIDPSNEVLRRDGERAWFTIPGDGARKTRPPEATVLILHGYRHFKNDWAYLMWARFLAQHGYRVALVDLRGHGGSTGDWCTFGPGEARDLVQVINDMNRRGLLAGKLGVLGGSFGGTTAIHLAGIEPRVEAVVTVSAFSIMRDALPSFAKAELGWFHGLVGVWGWDHIVEAAGHAGGFEPAATDARPALRQTRAAVLLTHSTSDRHVPPTHAEALAAAGGPRVRLELMDDAGHFDFGVKRADRVLRLTREWFDRHLK